MTEQTPQPGYVDESVFQHGMLGSAQKACALMPGRVEQGMYFYDLRGAGCRLGKPLVVLGD